MAGSERLRLFCALRLPPAAVDLLAAWQEAELGRERPVGAANLHLTLAFLGSRPADEVSAVAGALAAAAAEAGGIRLRVRDYHETRNVGMLRFDDEGGRAAELAERLQESLESLGVYRREARTWLPHVTVVRFRQRPGLEPSLPGLRDVCPSDAAVYSSVLRSGGAQYEILEEVRILGG